MNVETFDYSVDLMQVVLWQYSQAEKLLALITSKQEWYTVNQSEFWADWYDNVFNLLTADIFGIAVWSYILNLPLFVPTTPTEEHALWGFNQVVTFPDYINTYENFGYGNLANQGNPIILTLEEQRFLLRLRYYQISNRGSVWEINDFLDYLCGTSTDLGGTITVLDGLDMSITYVFDFVPSLNLRRVLVQYDLLPRPAGVGIKYVVLTGTVFGFGTNYQNFEHGNFITNYF